jgi:hypothetical protein
MVRAELTAGTHYSDQTQDKGMDPSRAAVGAVSLADVHRCKGTGQVDSELYNGHTAAGIKVHLRDLDG